MNKIRILTVVFFVIAVLLGTFLGYKIYEPIKRQKEVEAVEAGVVERLMMIRDAQKEYIARYGSYASDWNDLVAFVDTGVSYTISKNEDCKPRPIEQRHLGDTCTVTFDTLGSQPVESKIFPKSKYPDFELEKLPYVPNKEFKFDLWTDTIDMGGIAVHVIEVMDPQPEDSRRKKDHEYMNMRNLHFGSREKSSLEGNWPRIDLKNN